MWDFFFSQALTEAEDILEEDVADVCGVGDEGG